MCTSTAQGSHFTHATAHKLELVADLSNTNKILEQVVNHMIWTTKKHTGPQAYV